MEQIFLARGMEGVIEGWGCEMWVRGWAGRVWLGGKVECSVMGWEGDIWEVACECVGEMKCLGAARTFFLKIGLATNSDHGKTKKRERSKHVISRNSENHTFLEKTCKQEFQQNRTEATAVA